MVKARKERRWARVATAVALCLPCSSLSFRCTRLTLLRLKAAASLPPMRTQSQLNREVQPVQRTVSHSAASPRSLPAMRTQSQYVSTQRRCQRKPLRALNVTPLHRQRGVCPRPSKPAESRAALKKTQTSSRPSPSITNRTRRTPGAS